MHSGLSSRLGFWPSPQFPSLQPPGLSTACNRLSGAHCR
jgi:hypothetical protein